MKEQLKALLMQMHPETLRVQALSLLDPEPSLPQGVTRDGNLLYFTDSTRHVPWLARLIKSGDRYGTDDCLTAHGYFVEFWDRRYNHDPVLKAQFVARYFPETLRRSGGLVLDTATPDWTLDSRSMDLVRLYLLPKD